MAISGGISEDRARILMQEILANYETTVGGIRHSQNTAKFEKLFEMLNTLVGAWQASKIIGGILVLLCSAILGLLTYLAATHKSAAIVTSTPSTVASTFDATAR